LNTLGIETGKAALRAWIKRVIGLCLVFFILLPSLGLGAGVSSTTLRRDLLGLDKTLAEVLNRMDQLSEKSRILAHEVQTIKSEQQLGVIDHVRVEGLLARLREILLERRELKKIEESLKQEREKSSQALHEVLGEEIRILLKKGEEEVGEDIAAAARLHQEVLMRMEERKKLSAHRSPRILTLPQLEVPNVEGISPEEQREIAILLKDDAETLEQKKAELIKERDHLREELQIKQALSRFRGFPRGLQAKPIDQQVLELKAQLNRIEMAILGHDRVARSLFSRSEAILSHAEKEEEGLLE